MAQGRKNDLIWIRKSAGLSQAALVDLATVILAAPERAAVRARYTRLYGQFERGQIRAKDLPKPLAAGLQFALRIIATAAEARAGISSPEDGQ